jgi:hypothetical protein
MVKPGLKNAQNISKWAGTVRDQKAAVHQHL